MTITLLSKEKEDEKIWENFHISSIDKIFPYHNKWNFRGKNVYHQHRLLIPKICCSFENLSAGWSAVKAKWFTAKFLKEQQILYLGLWMDLNTLFGSFSKIRTSISRCPLSIQLCYEINSVFIGFGNWRFIILFHHRSMLDYLHFS